MPFLQVNDLLKIYSYSFDCLIILGVEPNADEEYSDWYEQDDYITCLFCQEKERNIYVLCIHMDGDHDFDFLEQTEKLDFYQKVKLVNYIRKQVHNNRCVFCDLSCEDVNALQKHFIDKKHCKVPKLSVFDQPE